MLLRGLVFALLTLAAPPAPPTSPHSHPQPVSLPSLHCCSSHAVLRHAPSLTKLCLMSMGKLEAEAGGFLFLLSCLALQSAWHSCFSRSALVELNLPTAPVPRCCALCMQPASPFTKPLPCKLAPPVSPTHSARRIHLPPPLPYRLAYYCPPPAHLASQLAAVSTDADVAAVVASLTDHPSLQQVLLPSLDGHRRWAAAAE